MTLAESKEAANIWYGSLEAFYALDRARQLRKGGAYKLVLKDYPAALAEAELRLAKFR